MKTRCTQLTHADEMRIREKKTQHQYYNNNNIWGNISRSVCWSSFFSDPALCFTGNTTDAQTLLQSIARYTGAEHRYRAVIAVAKRKVISLSEANWNKRFNKMRRFVVQCDHVYAESSQNNKTLQVICRQSGHLLSQGDVILSVINTSDDTRMPAVTDHYRRSEW